MENATDFISLLVMVTLAFICPILADRIPKHMVPETVFLLILGAAAGPYGFGFISTNDVIGFLAELGCGFLFLLAGREIDPSMLAGKEGKRGLIAWGISFALAVVLTVGIGGFAFGTNTSWAISIMLATTAIGTLMPILAERELMGTPVGNAVISYGTWGEICPILAIVLLLSARAPWQSVAILEVLVLLCVFIAARGVKARQRGSKIYQFMVKKANSTAQTMVRLTMFVLILLVTVSAVFDVDIVLGAFAAGFVLSYLVPKDDHAFEQKLNAMGYGFFIPVFFIYSGTKVDVSSVAADPALLVGFIAALLLVRSVPVYVMARLDKKNPHRLSSHASASVAVYCATALPLIVAVTNIAVSSGTMSQRVASVLVAAGAVTVFLMPLLGQVAVRAAGASEIKVASLGEKPLTPDATVAPSQPVAESVPNSKYPSTSAAPAAAPAASGAVNTAAPAASSSSRTESELAALWHRTRQELAGSTRGDHGKLHERYATHIALRLHVEGMMEAGATSEEIARYLAKELNFADDEVRVKAAERRIAHLQHLHHEERHHT
ncbi:MAG: cation:proton antiporter [Atopobiaceae bacterium]|jgi:Kef-type K+ transport system membrane component KefB